MTSVRFEQGSLENIEDLVEVFERVEKEEGEQEIDRDYLREYIEGTYLSEMVHSFVLLVYIGSKPVGILTAFLTPKASVREWLSLCNIFFVVPEHRGNPFLSYRMFKNFLRWSKEIGATEILVGRSFEDEKLHKALTKFGFKEKEVLYKKKIKR